MIAPRRNREVDDFVVRVETGQEGTANTKSTSSGNRLCDSDLDEENIRNKKEMMLDNDNLLSSQRAACFLDYTRAWPRFW